MQSMLEQWMMMNLVMMAGQVKMSQSWAAIKTDKNSIIVGSLFWGAAITLIFGAVILLIFKYFEYDLPIWYGIIFIVIIFPILTYSFYRTGSKKLKDKK